MSFVAAVALCDVPVFESTNTHEKATLPLLPTPG